MKIGNVKKVLLPNLPYLFFLWAFLKLGTAYRLAVGAAKFAKRQGLRVPEDLQIIGCNNSSIARYCDPELTSIDNQLGALCHQCVTTLMEVLAGKSSPTRTVFSAVLVERESTALKREED